jgi:ribosomal protein S18 acetylase RimI-like enzyme
MDLALASRVHRNLMEVSGSMADIPGGAVQYRDGELLFASRSALPFLNGAMREQPGGDAEGLLDRARSFFFGRERGFVTFAWPGDPELEQAALSAGMMVVEERYPEMVCRAALDVLPGDVRAVSDTGEAESYWAICNAAYPSLGFPDGLFDEAFDAEQLLERDHVWACVAYEDGRPVACASTWLAAGVGMIGWVAALPEVRGRGLAAACTVQATNQAFALGADVVSLQASKMGEQVYRRLGYEEIFPYRVLGAMPE